jgi:hypothetical protein
MQWLRHSELVLDFDMGSILTVAPTDSPAFASSLFGPSTGASAVDSAIAGGTAWSNVGNVLLNSGVYASATLAAVISSNVSSTSVGTSTGGGVAWTNPTNIDATGGSFATVALAAGGPAIQPTSTGGVSNSASPSNQRPANTYVTLGGFPSTPTTDATLYIQVNGSVSASQGGGVLTLNYSTDNGSTWILAQSWNATFSSVTIPVTLTGITNLNTVQLQLIANCSCAPTGFSNVLIDVPSWYAIVAGSGQPNSQTLSAAISGLTVPAGMTIKGLGISFNADYSGVAPTFQVGLNVGNFDPTFALTASPAIYTAGGSTALWGFTDWTAATLATLKVNFFVATTGTTTVNVNTLVVTVYYSQTVIPSDAIDITHLGFAVPSTSTPKGITASVLAYSNVAGATITAQLLKAGTPVGAAQTLPLPTDPTILTFGGLNQLFSAAWTYLDINAAGFGLRLTASTTSGSSIQVFVGYSTLQPYCPPTTPNLTYTAPDPGLVDGDGNPRPPQVMVRWSDDRGKTWSNEHVVDCGALGEYRVRAILLRLGRSRYRIYEVSMTDAVPWTLVDAYLEAKQ